ncbi:MAG: hypothetical protein ACXACD_10555 [Candidatus Thorarchaeota archaeon]|jgi:hypothetical protein
MNKAQLKKLIKPVVKECIQEVLIEEGLLTEVVSQVAAGMKQQPIVENTQKKNNDNLFNEDLQMKRKTQEVNQKLQEHRKKLLDSIGEGAYNGVDLFEGTEPMRESGTPGASHRPSVLGDDPRDEGVDISSLVGNASKVWQALK